MTEEQEKEFYVEITEFQSEVREKTDLACQLLSEAVILCDKIGLPYYFGISFLGNTYYPEELHEVAKRLESVTEDDEELEDKELERIRNVLYKAGIYDFTSEYGCGWEHSAVC